MDYADEYTLFNLYTPSSLDGEQSRQDRCRVGLVLHQGGPQVRALAQSALESSDAERRRVLAGGSARESPLGVAAARDWDASPPPPVFESEQEKRWLTAINKFDHQGSVPDFDTDIRKFIRSSDDRTYAALDADVVPRAGQAVLTRVAGLISEQKNTDAYLKAFRTFEEELGALYNSTPDDLTGIAVGMSADDARMFLQYGGFPRTAPAAESAELRLEVEALKARWAGCDFHNPADPYQALSGVVATAQVEWQAELGAQAGQRNDIVKAETQASKDMFNASYALTEAAGQAWVADRLLAWQKSMGPTWRPTEAFKAALKATQTAIDQQAVVAKNAVTSAKAQAVKVDAAQNRAAQIAATNHTPRGRGLAYGLQSAQVVKASVAATEAAAKAIDTAKKTSLATAATSAALLAQACAEMNALQALYRRGAAEEAAKQAKEAADATGVQVEVAKQAAGKAAEARTRAEKAESVAKTAAEDAHAKRGIAEREQRNAAAARARAETERVKAREAEARAQRQRDIAGTARTNADNAARTAADKRRSAEAAETRAVAARRDAVAAETVRDADIAKAEAAEARAAATDGTEDGTAARQAADEANAQADIATTAAGRARSAAGGATSAATAARAAATEATGAAERSRAASDAARADAATTSAQAAIAHAAAADAIAASAVAAGAVRAAEAEVRKAQAAAVSAAADAAGARVFARQARIDSGQAAGWATAAATSAVAARDAAALVTSPANEAIAIGTPFREIDASAGMAVLVGQNAKSIAEQQSAVAQVRVDEADKAAKAANAAADRADKNSKAAAVAASVAADEASRAAKLLQQVRQWAAAAATDAAAALKADANTAEYNRRAQEDAAAADRAATTAEADAAAARDAADAAERDAESARSLANAAEADASAARESAAQADRDADAAERAAANARASADQAESAKILAEVQARNNASAVALSENGPTGAAGLQAVPNLKDDVTDDGDCRIPWDNINVCDLKVTHHITGTVTYLVRSCPDPGDTYCPEAYTIDYLGVQNVDIREVRTERIDVTAVRRDVLANFGYAMVSDFVECARAEKPNWKTSCAWAAGTIVAPVALKIAARSVLALRVAMRTGVGIEEAYVAVRAAGIESAALAKLEKDTAAALIAKCRPHSFVAKTRVVMADGSHKPIAHVKIGDHVLATDPATGSTVTSRVSQTFHHRDVDLTDVTIRGRHGRVAIIHTTRHHPFWDVNGHRWVDAAELTVGTKLNSLRDKTATVVAVESFTRPTSMFDLTVEGLHTYYVLAGRTPVLVHNINCVGAVPYRGTALAQLAHAARVKVGFPSGRNVAAARVQGSDDVIYGFSKGDGFHSEDDIIAQIEKLRADGHDVGKITQLYSDRQPCPVCAGKLDAYLAGDAQVTWAVPWGDSTTALGKLINRQSNELLDTMIRSAAGG